VMDVDALLAQLRRRRASFSNHLGLDQPNEEQP
jgi:hypothetical protein